MVLLHVKCYVMLKGVAQIVNCHPKDVNGLLATYYYPLVWKWMMNLVHLNCEQYYLVLNRHSTSFGTFKWAAGNWSLLHSRFWHRIFKWAAGNCLLLMGAARCAKIACRTASVLCFGALANVLVPPCRCGASADLVCTALVHHQICWCPMAIHQQI